MKKLVILGMGVCMVLALASCKSKESAYKKAYEKAKQQELAEQTQQQQEVAPVKEVVPVVTEAKVVESAPVAVRQERVTVVTGSGLKDYSVVCGSFGVQANADNLKNQLAQEGYNTMVVVNEDAAPGTPRYRVIIASFDDRASAAQARDAFKAKYPNRKDFQGAWLLYRIK